MGRDGRAIAIGVSVSRGLGVSPATVTSDAAHAPPGAALTGYPEKANRKPEPPRREDVVSFTGRKEWISIV